jgi:hypothetical protein
LDGFIGNRGDAIEKKIDPAFPVAFQPNEVEASVVLFAMAFEEKAKIEERCPQ